MENILHLTLKKNSEQKYVTQIWELFQELKELAAENNNQELIQQIKNFRILPEHSESISEEDFFSTKE